MATTFFLTLMLFYYACHDDPENRYIKRLNDDAAVRRHELCLNGNRFLHIGKYICVCIIILKCLGLLEW